MNTALWIATVFLALTFARAGYLKLAKPRNELAANGLAWVEDFTDPQVRAIGTLEVLGALGLLLPPLLRVLPVLVPLAACGLGLIMIGAAVVHARRGEVLLNVLLNLALLAIAGFVAAGRFGPNPV